MSSVVFQSSPPFNWSSGPFKYLVYTPDSAVNFYARNGKTGVNDNPTTTDAATVIQFAITNA